MKSKAVLFACVLAFALTGCIEIDNIGAQWEEGRIDPALEGSWMMQQKEARSAQSVQEYTFILDKEGAHYSVAPLNDPDEPMLAKTLDIGGATFLLLRDPPEPPQKEAAPAAVNGALWRYAVAEKDGLSAIEYLRLKPGAAAEIEKESGGLLVLRQAGDTQLYAITVLKPETLEALAKLTAKPDLWELWAGGEKIRPGE